MLHVVGSLERSFHESMSVANRGLGQEEEVFNFNILQFFSCFLSAWHVTIEETWLILKVLVTRVVDGPNSSFLEWKSGKQIRSIP